MKIQSIVLLALALSIIGTVTAEPAPSMWMEQHESNIDLMVNTDMDSSGANAWIHFDPAYINITDIDFTGSPWQPMVQPGWSHQGDYVILSLVNFAGVLPGQYKIAELTITPLQDNCTTEIGISHAEPVGVIVTNLSYHCKSYNLSETIISIGNGTGTVTIPLSISNAYNVGAIDVTLRYDPDVVNLYSVTDGAMDLIYVNMEHTEDGWARFGAIQSDNPGVSGDFTLLDLDFEPVSWDRSCALELIVTTFTDASPNCKPLLYIIKNGIYTSLMNGDVNNDDQVDLLDVGHIIKHVIGIQGYETINVDAADVDGDGTITISDAMYLAKHIAGISGFEELQ